MDMPGREYVASEAYGYEFNGKETDEETFDGAQDFGLREYDNRLGRFFSKDPFTTFVFNKTPYSFAGNSPITFIDQNGGFQIVPELTGGTKKQRAKLKHAMRIVHNLVHENPTLSNPFIREFLLQSGLPLDNNGLVLALQTLSYGSGPLIVIRDMNNVPGFPTGYWDPLTDYINIAVDQLEPKGEPFGYLSRLLSVTFTLWHESIHFASAYNGAPPTQPPIGLPDIGDQAEINIFGIDLMGNQTFLDLWNGRASAPPPADPNHDIRSINSAHKFVSRYGANSNMSGFWSQSRGYSINPSDISTSGQRIGGAAKKIGKWTGKIATKIGKGISNAFKNMGRRYTWIKK